MDTIDLVADITKERYGKVLVASMCYHQTLGDWKSLPIRIVAAETNGMKGSHVDLASYIHT